MMRPAEKKLIVTFHTTAGAMAMEKLCRERSVPGRLIPVPRSISSDCGIAWCMLPEDRPLLEQVTAGQTLEISGYYEVML